MNLPRGVPDLEAMIRLIEIRGVRDRRVLAALRAVPRHGFIDRGYEVEAYADTPLPIGFGQTISQPYIVALMTEAARVGPGDRVLEVGTGSGYQTAVLGQLAARVISIERLPELARLARERLADLGLAGRVSIREGDGAAGCPEEAPFQAIVVTCAAPEVPPALLEQLAPGGRLVIPVGPAGGSQSLQLIHKRPDGTTLVEDLGGVRFVPLL